MLIVDICVPAHSYSSVGNFQLIPAIPTVYSGINVNRCLMGFQSSHVLNQALQSLTVEIPFPPVLMHENAFKFVQSGYVFTPAP